MREALESHTNAGRKRRRPQKDRSSMTQPPKVAARRRWPISAFVWLALLVAVSALVFTNVGELRKIAGALADARWQAVVLAAAVELLFLVNLGFFYANTFRASGISAGAGRYVLLSSASNFVNLVSKTGGLGGIALFLEEGRRRREPAARVTAAYMTVYALGYGAYVLTLAVALGLLYLRGSLQPVELVASGIMLTLIIGIAVGVAMSLRNRALLERLFMVASRPPNVLARLLGRRPFVERPSARRAAAELYDAIMHIRRRPGRFVLPAGHALAVELLSAFLLYTVARAFHGNLGFEAALAAYAISLLFSMIAITPSGLGFVETSLSVLLISFGMPRQDAIATALGYRLFEFWLPVLLGAISLWWVRRGFGRSEGPTA